jgi:hypothetical protein
MLWPFAIASRFSQPEQCRHVKLCGNRSDELRNDRQRLITAAVRRL